jgi:hypothetical protein
MGFIWSAGLDLELRLIVEIQEVKHVGLFEYVDRLINGVALYCQGKHACLVGNLLEASKQEPRICLSSSDTLQPPFGFDFIGATTPTVKKLYVSGSRQSAGQLA